MVLYMYIISHITCHRLVILFNAQPQAIEKSQSDKILVDGFPRNHDNLQGWEREVDDKVNVKFVLFFDCPEEVRIIN